MLVIRLRRTGRKKQATYDLVVAEKANAVKGKFLEKVGSYNSIVIPKELKFDIERINYWIAKGAQPSDTLASLLKRNGVSDMEKFIVVRSRVRKSKKGQPEPKAPAAAPAKAEEAAPVVEDAPVEVEEAVPVAEEAPAEEAKTPETTE
ncbi:MAG: 30S ribosomal protein S16 [Candidatus Peregrinibacteria bacterium]|nr:30S ribosomal protein S16 [Candidatus Peregrinibacteria bacterium]MDZ4245141.1 30S ribosomal protein S16 [Candidatus Gracilibacteria bacterium]